jgi:hypothetical protein
MAIEFLSGIYGAVVGSSAAQTAADAQRARSAIQSHVAPAAADEQLIPSEDREPDGRSPWRANAGGRNPNEPDRSQIVGDAPNATRDSGHWIDVTG